VSTWISTRSAGLALAAVAGHRITVIEMWMLPRVELNLAPRVRAKFNIAVTLDPLDGRQFAVSEFLFVVRSRELHAVALRELALAVAVYRYTLQAARIIAQLLAAVPLHCERVAFASTCEHARVLSGSMPRGFAAFRVAQYVALLVVSARAAGPRPSRPARA